MAGTCASCPPRARAATRDSKRWYRVSNERQLRSADAGMRTIALKVDADTWRGTREGVPRLARLLQHANAAATFLFSLGPDHTGRALRRIFRRGFLAKVRRTSVVSHYGLPTLLYGTLLPGPMIGRLSRVEMREVMHQGFEVGVHAYDHVKWQDGVARASLEWTRRQMRLA